MSNTAQIIAAHAAGDLTDEQRDVLLPPRSRKRPERMSQGFAVFNLHVNNAGRRADAEFIAQFGQKKFDRVIAPLHRAGIMSIFHGGETKLRLAWVTLVTAFVNENRS